MHKLYVVLVVIVTFLLAGSVFYFKYVSPAFVAKPEIERPEVTYLGLEPKNSTVIEEAHVQYMANEMGGYMLHADPITHEEAVMELKMTSTGETFTIKVAENIPEVTRGQATKPDLRLSTDQETMIKILQAEDFNQKILESVNEGKVTLEILTDEKTLALKGYKAIYDSLK